VADFWTTAGFELTFRSPEGLCEYRREAGGWDAVRPLYINVSGGSDES
jgi:hypothetical protein